MKQLVLLLMITFSQTMWAQAGYNYHSFLKEGKVWNCQIVKYVFGEGYQKTEYSLRLSGDSIVNGRRYYKMYKDLDGASKLFDYGLWREENAKVYACLYGQERLLYDFSLTIGSSAYIAGIFTVLDQVDTVKVGQNRFCRYSVLIDGYPLSSKRIWIEGVGHPGGPFQIWGTEINDGCQYTLLSCYEDNQCIFTANDFNAPGTNDIAPIKQQVKINSCLFDLQGRRLKGEPKHGLYIKDGKKVVK